MAPAFTFLLGSLDLSAYVRVGPGEGLDPYDADGFEDPQWSDGPLAEGQPLQNMDVKNRQQTWPLFLNASSKDLLHGLQRSIAKEIRYGAKPLRVKWQAAGATDPTYYDIAAARFDPEYSMRQSDKGWQAGKLTVWSQPPYGHTATERVIGTVSALPMATIPLASFGGDMNSLLEVGWSTPSLSGQVGASAPALLTFLSVLPPGMRTFWDASTMGAGGGGAGTATVVLDSTSLASVFVRAIRAPGGGGLTMASMPIGASSIPTHSRVLAVLRRSGTGMLTTQYVDGFFSRVRSATAVSVHSLANSWQAVDLSTLKVNRETQATLNLNVTITVPSNAATVTVGLAGFLFLPEDDTVILRQTDLHNYLNPDVVGPNQTSPGDSDVAAASYTLSAARESYLRLAPTDLFPDGNRAIDDALVGPFPQPQPQASQALFFGLLRTGASGAIRTAVDVKVAVRERFTFAR